MMNKQENFEVMNITPHLANEFLKRNKTNRPLSRSWVYELRNRIVCGQWQYNGETIKFDENGDLIDGQHRLSAVLLSDRPIKSAVIRKLPHIAFETIDDGKKRGASDVLSIYGEKNYTSLASLLRLIHLYENNNKTLPKRRGNSLPNQEAIKILNKHPEARQSATFAASYVGRFKYATKTTVSFCHWLFYKISPKDTDRFFDALATGVGLEKGSPVLLLRDKFIYNYGARARLDNTDWCHFVIITWNLFRRGKLVKVKNLNIGVDDPFPTAI